MHPAGTKILLKRVNLGGNFRDLLRRKVCKEDDTEIYGVLDRNCLRHDEYVKIVFENGEKIELFKYRVTFLDEKFEPPKKRGHYLTKIFI